MPMYDTKSNLVSSFCFFLLRFGPSKSRHFAPIAEALTATNMHFSGSLFIIFGLAAQIYHHQKIGVSHFITSHSWLGLFTSVVYILQVCPL